MQNQQEKIYKTKTTGRFCPRCNERFTRQFCYELHLSKCLGVPLPSCIKCGKQFNSKTSMYRHRKDCKNELQIKSEFDANLRKKCPKCQKCFKQQLCYDFHLCKCLGAPHPTCENCGKIYYSRSSMYRHKNICTEKPVYNMDIFEKEEYLSDSEVKEEYDNWQAYDSNEDEFPKWFEDDYDDKDSILKLETSNQVSKIDENSQMPVEQNYCWKCNKYFQKQLWYDLHMSKCNGATHGKLYSSRTSNKNVSTSKQPNNIEYASYSDEERLDKVLSMNDLQDDDDGDDDDDDSIQLVEPDSEKENFIITKTDVKNVYRLYWN